MPEVIIDIGNRSFEVACQEGEESFLKSAAAMLDTEAQVLAGQIGRLPEARMLLMAGLMLADKTAGLEDQVAKLTASLAERDTEIEALKNAEPERVEVPIIPTEVNETLAELAAQAESMVVSLEEKAAK